MALSDLVEETEIDLAKVKRMHDRGDSYRQIAAQLGVNYNTLYSKVRRHGTKVAKKPHVTDLPSNDVLLEEYLAGMSYLEMAQKYNVAQSTIYNRVSTMHGYEAHKPTPKEDKLDKLEVDYNLRNIPMMKRIKILFTGSV